MIRVCKEKFSKNIFDIELEHPKSFAHLDALEVHIILYPYSREINSKHIVFNPFEEYAEDVLSGNHSAYSLIERSFAKYFGILLGGCIAGFFAYFKPEDLLSVESVVGIFAAYAIGKEMWADFERALYKLTKSKRLRYQESYYKYELEKTTTLTNYSQIAKKIRYGKSSPLPEKMHFMQLSNSQTVRLYFNPKEWDGFESDIHLLSVRIDKDKVQELHKHGFLLGVKVSLNKKRFFIKKSLEYFQSIHRGELGCLDEEQNWVRNAVHTKTVFSLGKFKYYAKRKTQENHKILDSEI